mgnify:CR=1 FL=1
MSKGKTTKRPRIRWAKAHTCTCAMCGATFQSIRPAAQFCGPRCRMAHHRGVTPLVQSEGGEGQKKSEQLFTLSSLP